ncbi:unnamed protein product [Caenorhabditis angaria]|uniref:PDZ domain-containing protein n=1 Tax=Caenorhabditis angaria TaxID=860376 RepID=A0A9P1N1A6_9PELO|nr:unnamed protein product [Caenorhabditis angaria]
MASDKKRPELSPIPEGRAKNLQRYEGFSYGMATMKWIPNGPKLGMGIKDFRETVIVSRCNAGSLSERCLAEGDLLIDVDGTPVNDRSVAKDLLVKNIQENGKVTFVVERPDSNLAKRWVDYMLTRYPFIKIK